MSLHLQNYYIKVLPNAYLNCLCWCLSYNKEAVHHSSEYSVCLASHYGSIGKTLSSQLYYDSKWASHTQCCLKKDSSSNFGSFHLSGHRSGCGDVVQDRAVEARCSHCPHQHLDSSLPVGLNDLDLYSLNISCCSCRINTDNWIVATARKSWFCKKKKKKDYR